MMKLKIPLVILAGLSGPLSAAAISDDFSGGLGDWNSTVILDANGGGSNTSAFQVNGSNQLELSTTSYDGIEQYAFIRSGAALGVGEEAQLTMSLPVSGNRNFGLYVGGTAPTAGVRQDYISVYGQSTNSRAFQRGFDGTSEYTNLFDDPTGAVSSLFIARTASNTFEAGFYDSSGRVVITTLNPATANSAEFVGVYADSRATGTVGAIDSFQIVPRAFNGTPRGTCRPWSSAPPPRLVPVVQSIWGGRLPMCGFLPILLRLRRGGFVGLSPVLDSLPASDPVSWSL